MSNILQLHTVRCPVPSTVNGKVPPRRQKNTDLRSREYLTQDEVARLVDAAGKTGRHRYRDRRLSLLARDRSEWWGL